MNLGESFGQGVNKREFHPFIRRGKAEKGRKLFIIEIE